MMKPGRVSTISRWPVGREIVFASSGVASRTRDKKGGERLDSVTADQPLDHLDQLQGSEGLGQVCVAAS